MKAEPNRSAFFVYSYMGTYVKKLGTEKQKDVDTDFDAIFDKYKNKAESEGYFGDLKFQKERGKIVVFVELLDDVDED